MTLDSQKKSLPPWLEKFSLDGKIAIITGAGSGLGAAVAKGMAMSGAFVILADINLQAAADLASELQNAGLNGEALNIDVTNAREVSDLADRVTKEYGKIDILANIAGIAKRMPTEDFDEEVFDKIMDVNLRGSFLCLKYAGRKMLEQGFGSIINFGSIASVVANPESMAYSCSKGGVVQMTRTAGVEWAKRGVRVNAIIPGTFYTPLLQQILDKDPAYAEYFLARYPIGRFGDPEEIVGACVYLASDASSFVTGSLLSVDGGCTAY